MHHLIWKRQNEVWSGVVFKTFQWLYCGDHSSYSNDTVAAIVVQSWRDGRMESIGLRYHECHVHGISCEISFDKLKGSASKMLLVLITGI